MNFNIDHTLENQYQSYKGWLSSLTAKSVIGLRSRGLGDFLALAVGPALLMLTQCDQMGFLFWMKASIPSCPSCRARLSTMAWEVR